MNFMSRELLDILFSSPKILKDRRKVLIFVVILKLDAEIRFVILRDIQLYDVRGVSGSNLRNLFDLLLLSLRIIYFIELHGAET